jgi:Acetyltransferase (GNAT) domain
MRPDELATALDWAAREGWNPGLHDATPFWAADPNGFFVHAVGGVPVATLSAVRYRDEVGFVGLYIVEAKRRGLGYGLELWRHALAHLDGCVVGLDAVVDQVPTYRRSGFAGTWSNHRYVLEHPVDASHTTVDLSEVAFDRVLASDRAGLGAERPEFVQAWITVPGARGRAIVDADGDLTAWGLRRPCRAGHKIGPLLADDGDTAEAVLRDLLADTDGPFYLDAPDANPAVAAFVRGLDMPVVFDTVRMYRGGAAPVAVEQVFGVASLELG